MNISLLFCFPAHLCVSTWRDPEPTNTAEKHKGVEMAPAPYFLFFICICQKSRRNKRKHGEETPSAPALGHLRFVCLQSDIANLRSVSVLCLWYPDASPRMYAQQFPRSLHPEQSVSLTGCLSSSLVLQKRNAKFTEGSDCPRKQGCLAIELGQGCLKAPFSPEVLARSAKNAGFDPIGVMSSWPVTL